MKENSPIPIFVLMTSLCMGISSCVVRNDTTDPVLLAVLESLTSWAQPMATQSSLPVEPAAGLATVDVLDYSVASENRALLSGVITTDSELSGKSKVLFDEQPPLSVPARIVADANPRRSSVDFFRRLLKCGTRTAWAILNTSFLKIANTEIPLAECLIAATTQAGETNGGTEISLEPQAWGLPLVSPFAAEYLIDVTLHSSLLKSLHEAGFPPDEIDSLAVPEVPGLQRSFPGGTTTEGTTRLKSTGTTWMGGGLAAVLVVFGLVMIGRVLSTPPLPQ